MQDIVLFVQHNQMLFAILLAVLLILVVVEFINQKRATAQLSPTQATHLINRSNAVIVDIRPATVFTEGHIIGAVSLPVTDLKDKLKKIEKYKSQPVLITCASGVESARASTVLAEQGFDVRILAGGMRAWTDADMPLVKG